MDVVKSGDLPKFVSQIAFEGRLSVTTSDSSASSTAGAFLILRRFTRPIPSTPNLAVSAFRWQQWLLAFICLLSLVPPLLAADSSEEPPIQLDEVISATRQETVLEQTSAFGQAITQDALQHSASSALDEVLREARHIQVHSYGPGGLSSLRMRGASSEQVLILIDGERLNSTQSGGTDLSQILLNGVQRVEILRGGQSALYGADAMGGIIYITTEIPHKPRLVFSSGTGSFGLRQWRTDASTGWGALRFGASYSADRAEGDFEFDDLYGNVRTRSNADYARNNARAQLMWTGLGKLHLTAEHFDGEHGSPGPVGQASEIAFQTDVSNGIRARWEQALTGRLSYRINTHLRHRNLHYHNPEPFYINALHKVDSAGVEGQGSFLWSESLEHPFIFGASLRQDEVESSSVGSRDRNAASVYAQQEWRRGRLYVFPAFRLDTYSDFDAGLSPKLGWRIALHPDVSVKGNTGRSYRAPALNDLYWPEDGYAKGNPELEPERSNDFDIGFQAKMERASAGVSGSLVFFHNSFQNRILWAPVEGGKWTPSNLNDATHQGIELETQAHYSLLRFDLGYTFLTAKDSNDKHLIYTAQHTFSSSAQVEYDILWAKWTTHYESKRYTTRSNTRYLDPYLKHDLQVGVRKDVSDRASLIVTAEIRNLFDTEYLLVKDYPLPGREARLKASIEWGGHP